MKDIATKYYNAGLSVVPVSADKIPTIKWKERQSKLIQPNSEFDTAKGVAIVAGDVSGGLECLDIDLKYDISGTLMDRFKALIKESDSGLLKKLLVEKTTNGGYHFIYRYPCEEKRDGNLKLASRYTTEEERSANPKETVLILLETRGEGGYFVAAPSSGYEIIQGDFDNLPLITTDERNTLIACARALDEVKPDVVKIQVPKSEKQQGLSPFEDYNKRGDLLDFLVSEGWSVYKEDSKNYFLKRPGKENKGKWAATLRKEDNVFYVFSKSVEMEFDKAYSPSSVYIQLKHNGDVSAAAKDLLAQGFGERTEYKKPETKKSEPKIKADENDLSFLASDQKVIDYVNAVYTNTLQLGLPTGIPQLDDHFRFKRGNFNVIGGHDNVGKTAIMLYLLTQSAMLHNWKWFIVSVENSAGYIFRKLMEYYLCKPVNQMSEEQLFASAKFVKAHFFIVDNENSYSYVDILAMSERMKKVHNIDGVLIDPYNAVEFDEQQLKLFGDHNYHYKVTTEFRKFCKLNDCCIYLNCHAVTEALRRVWTKDNAPSTELVGYPMPPKKSDVEGGGKFANRADDFIILHRYVQSEEKYRITEIHIVKVKEVETGGRITHLGKPVKIEMSSGNCGFIDSETYQNFITKKYENNIQSVEHWQNR